MTSGGQIMIYCYAGSHNLTVGCHDILQNIIIFSKEKKYFCHLKFQIKKQNYRN